MYIIKNAWISITRNKGRNILIGVIVLIIGAAATIALAINNTANDLIGSYESAYEKEVTIAFNREDAMKDFDFSDRDSITDMSDKFGQMESYTISDIENFADSEHVEGYYYTYGTSLNGSNIEKAEAETDSSSGDRKQGGFGGFGGGMSMPDMQMGGASSLDFTITGYSSLDSMSEFIDGTYTMSEIADDAWDKAFDGNYVFINSELAAYNDLSVGAEVVLADEDGNTYSFTVIGIYEESDAESSNVMSIFSNSANTIITNAAAVAGILATNSELSAQLTPTFIIDDYDNLATLQDEFYAKGLDETYILESNEELANSGLKSVENVRGFASTFLIITLVIGGAVLFVINMINIRERKYEIGVFRTIGMSKMKLSLQFMSELAMVSLVALILGAGIGAAMSQGVSNSLLESEISSSNSSMENVKNNFGGGGPGNTPSGGEMPSGGNGGGFDFSDMKISGTPTISAYDSIDAVVNIGVIFELLGLGLVLVLISSLASMISIQRFSPLTILKERS